MIRIAPALKRILLIDVMDYFSHSIR